MNLKVISTVFAAMVAGAASDTQVADTGTSPSVQGKANIFQYLCARTR
jgi:hypothetical protein